MKKTDSFSNNNIAKNNNFCDRVYNFLSSMKDPTLLLIIFVLCFVCLFTQQFYTKKLGVFDEVTYYNIAKNIFFDHNFKFYGLRTYQIILYPLVISPFFAINNPITRLQAICIFNSFLFASSIFPIWYVGKELKISRKHRYLILLFAILSPIMTFSYVIMAEALYYPLTLWLFVLTLHNFKKPKWYFSILSGVLFYLIFLTKQMGVILFISYILISALFPIFCYAISKNKQKLKTYFKKDAVMNLLIVFSIFVFCYFLFRYTIFSDPTTDSIHSILKRISVLFSDFKNFGFVAYWILNFLISFIASLLIFPVFYEVIHLKKINKDAQFIFLYAALYLVIISIYVAVGITLPEEGLVLISNVHLRYSIPMHILLISVFVSLCENNKNIFSFKNNKKQLIFFIFLSIIFIFIFKGNRYAYVDANFLCIYTSYTEFLKAVLPNVNIYMFYFILVITNSFLIFLLIIFNNFFLSKKRVKLSAFLCSCISVANLTVGFVMYHKNSEGNLIEIREIFSINNYLNSDSNVLCLVQQGGWSSFVIEPYIDKSDKKFIIENQSVFKNSMINNLSESYIITKKVIDIPLSPLHAIKTTNLDKIDYILLPTNIQLDGFLFSNVELVNQNPKYWQLYKNNNASEISIEM